MTGNLGLVLVLTAILFARIDCLLTRSRFSLAMGGNAIKKIAVKRLSESELRRVQSDLSARLHTHRLAHAFPLEVPGKKDFGDVDVLLTLKDDEGREVVPKKDLHQWIQETFLPEEIHAGGNVYSLAYESQYQVDLIVVPDLEMARFYFSFGEVGAVLGRCARAHELAYGHEGLYALLGVNKENRVLLTNCPREICAYLGLDHDQWTRGFLSVAEINAWITSCALFHPSLFASRSQPHRKQSLRPLYAQFIDYITFLSVDNNNNGEENSTCWIARDRSEEAIARFNKHHEVALIEREQQRLAEYKAKFNAKLFMERGVPTAHLAKTMAAFKHVFDVEKASSEEIADGIDWFLKDRVFE